MPANEKREMPAGERKKIVVCGTSSYMEDRIRLFKLKKVLDANGVNYCYWGWRRSHSKELQLDYEVQYLARGGKGKMVAVKYLWWMNALFWKLLFVKSYKDKIFYCVGFEAGLPAYMVSRIRGIRYIFDNPDNIYLSHNLPGFVIRVLRSLEKKIAGKAKKHVLPSKSRWEHELKNEFYIPNTPLREDIENARNLTYVPFSKSNPAQLVVYVTGRLVKVRGLELLRNGIMNIEPEKVLWVIAGYVDDDMKDLFSKYENVCYLGRVSATESLALYYQSDLVFAFYDPALPINRIAESNKWWDCVATGTPFISNHGILNLKVFKDTQSCLLIEYDNHAELTGVLNKLYHERRELDALKQRLSGLSYASWESIIEIFN